jgi:hypothetical protein
MPARAPAPDGRAKNSTQKNEATGVNPPPQVEHGGEPLGAAVSRKNPAGSLLQLLKRFNKFIYSIYSIFLKRSVILGIACESAG